MLQLQLLHPESDLAEIKTVWTDLAGRCPHSYFLSWGWVETWIASLPANSGVRLAVWHRQGSPVAAAFLGHGKVVRQHLFRSTAYLLNQTGDRVLDQLYIEDNGFLSSGSGLPWDQMLAVLPGKWDEFYLSGLDDEYARNLLREVPQPFRAYIAIRIPAPYVDLQSIREKGKEYLSLLSSNTRSQVRRCYRLYEERGTLVRTVARDVASALEIYGELVELHQRWWVERGEKGAFASSWFRAFHKSLIERRFDSGELQLVRVCSGDTTVGCLYNFVHNGTVSFYQSGLRIEQDNRLKPGFICHTEAIRHSLESGHCIYDFMASFDDYKVRMATGQRELVWVRIQKPKLKFAIERLARSGALYTMGRYREMKSGRRRPGSTPATETAS